MNRRALLTMVAAAAIAACSRDTTRPTPASAPDPADAVRPIYTPYMTENATFPQFRDEAPWSADLWAKIEVMIQRSDEIDEPILDFDPAIGAQDGRVSNLVLTTESLVENSHATVRARFTNLDRQDEIVYDLIWENGGWRVDNIRGDDWDLRQIVTTLPAASGEGP